MTKCGMTIAPAPFPPSFYRVTASKWCRHKDQFLSVAIVAGAQQITCSNCSSVATGASYQTAHDALMKLEAVGAVSEVAAP
jgi:hypothetical protein